MASFKCNKRYNKHRIFYSYESNSPEWTAQHPQHAPQQHIIIAPAIPVDKKYVNSAQ